MGIEALGIESEIMAATTESEADESMRNPIVSGRKNLKNYRERKGVTELHKTTKKDNRNSSALFQTLKNEAFPTASLYVYASKTTLAFPHYSQYYHILAHQ
nr:hypothetical protein Iba_chr01cCG17510 [Ipomoea batatas]